MQPALSRGQFVTCRTAGLSPSLPLAYNQHHQTVGAVVVSAGRLHSKRKTSVTCWHRLVIGLLLAWMVGCQDAAGPVQQAANTTGEAAPADPGMAPPQQDEPTLDDEPEGTAESESTAGEKTEDVSGPQELQLEGIAFVVPGSWKRVKPQTNIIEAEFELPRAAGDEYDGRLTLMSSGGDPQEVIAIRKSEFKIEPGESATTESLRVGDLEASLVDLRGEWKGTSFRPMPPRPDYRMLLFVLPFSERSAFYAKLTGPRTTVASHEEAFRDFLRSARITRDRSK